MKPTVLCLTCAVLAIVGFWHGINWGDLPAHDPVVDISGRLIRWADAIAQFAVENKRLPETLDEVSRRGFARGLATKYFVDGTSSNMVSSEYVQNSESLLFEKGLLHFFEYEKISPERAKVYCVLPNSGCGVANGTNVCRQRVEILVDIRDVRK